MPLLLTGSQAWNALLKSPHSRWGVTSGPAAHASVRLSKNDIFDPITEPKFKVREDAKFFCIGSCFARNIEEHLMYREYTVLSKPIRIPKSEWDARPNGITNKFTSMSILQELQWAFGAPAPSETLVEAEGGYVDLQLAPRTPPVTKERAVQRRAYLSEYFRRVRDADVIILTLGYIEVWFDTLTQTYLNTAPSFWTQKKYPNRYTFSVQSHSACVNALEEIRTVLSAHSSKTPAIVVTVSPVPLSETFTGDDVVIANRRSKSTLLSAATEFAANHSDVAYFPSFEIVTETPRNLAFEASDLRHVRDEIVERIMEKFLRLYASERPLKHPTFREMTYLNAYPDVDEAVRDGVYTSGYEHWCLIGQRQGRNPRGV